MPTSTKKSPAQLRAEREHAESVLRKHGLVGNSPYSGMTGAETLDHWESEAIVALAAEKRAQKRSHDMAATTKTSKTTKTDRQAKQLAKEVNETPANKKAPKLTEAEAKKQIVADRMAHARAVAKAKREAAANPKAKLADVKAAKAARSQTSEGVPQIAKGAEMTRPETAKERKARLAREEAAGAEMRLRDMAKADQEDRTQEALEKITPAGHGPVHYYYQAECPTCGTVVKVPADERGRRIPLGTIEMDENGEMAGNPKLTKKSKAGKVEGKTKTGRAKRDLTPEQRQAIADRLQGARAAKLGLTLEGLRAIKLRPGQTPTPAQLKKYGVKPAAKKSGK